MYMSMLKVSGLLWHNFVKYSRADPAAALVVRSARTITVNIDYNNANQFAPQHSTAAPTAPTTPTLVDSQQPEE